MSRPNRTAPTIGKAEVIGRAESERVWMMSWIETGHAKRLMQALCLVSGLHALVSLPALAADAPVSFSGKTVRIIVGSSAGGGFDAYARVIAAHLGQNIPGNPSVIVQNMTGAGSIVAANYIANVAPKDGTVIGAVYPTIVTDWLFYPDLFRFEVGNVKWVGNALRETHVATVWHLSRIQTLDDVFDREFVVAGAGGTTTLYPALLNGVLGTRFKVVTGYAGTAEGNLAMERGEVDGSGGINWASVKATQAQALRGRQLQILVQFGLSRNDELPGVPWIYDYVRNGADRAAFDLVLGTQKFGRPYLVAEGVPDATVSVLRAAFDRTVNSRDFRADAERRGLDVDATSGVEIETAAREILATSPHVVNRVKRLLEGTPR